MLCPPTMPTSPFSVPLPKSWPEHAKAATLHIISLAHFVLTHVRGFAVNSPIHRVRLAGERDRLDSEVALLREEIRIKDARMAALAPHRRPHYSPTERMAILEMMAPVVGRRPRLAATSSSPTTPLPAGVAGLRRTSPARS
jgi:hypothetical protein